MKIVQSFVCILCITIGLPLYAAKLLVNYTPSQDSQDDYVELTITAKAPEWICPTVYDYKLNKNNNWTYDEDWGMCDINTVSGRILHHDIRDHRNVTQTPFTYSFAETNMYAHRGIKIYPDGWTQPLNYDANTKKK